MNYICIKKIQEVGSFT